MTPSPPTSSAALAAKVLTLGFAAGLRSITPLALLALAAQRHPDRRAFAAGAGHPLSLLRSHRALALGGMAVAGEFVADKLPFIPSRLTPVPFTERVVAGALVGAAVSLEARRSPWLGAALGAATGASGAVLGALYRIRLGPATRLPDVVVAVVEDVASGGLSVLALRRHLL